MVCRDRTEYLLATICLQHCTVLYVLYSTVAAQGDEASKTHRITDTGHQIVRYCPLLQVLRTTLPGKPTQKGSPASSFI